LYFVYWNLFEICYLRIGFYFNHIETYFAPSGLDCCSNLWLSRALPVTNIFCLFEAWFLQYTACNGQSPIKPCWPIHQFTISTFPQNNLISEIQLAISDLWITSIQHPYHQHYYVNYKFPKIRSIFQTNFHHCLIRRSRTRR
jgi:hypothetical protein